MKGSTFFLILIFLLLCGNLFFLYINFKQIQVLQQENTYLNTNLWMKIDSVQQKIDSVQQICNQKPKKQKTAKTKETTSTGSTLLDYLFQYGEDIAQKIAKTMAMEKVEVSTKYRLEDRYVSYQVEEPEYKGNETGEVTLDILVSQTGKVKSAKIQSTTGITNEEVIEACKKAALKTDFNYNEDHRENKAGTITYIFTEKQL